MFDIAITDFSDFDVVMKMNLLQSAKNLCDEMYVSGLIDNSEYYSDCKDDLQYLLEVLDNEIH